MNATNYIIRRGGVLFGAFLILVTGSAAQEFKANYKPTINAPRISEVIKIDGDLSDPGWQSASRTDAFVETDPGDQIKPGVKSEAIIAYDDTYLYIGLIAWDNGKQVRSTWCERDNIWRDDYFGVMLDTYGDHSSGYEIFVNPMGIQGDLRITNSSGNEDMSHDLIYYSAGKVTDSGYQVELAIPFSSLRFPNTDEQTWRVQFWRDRQREARYRYSWAAISRNDPCWLCQWGTLTGIKGVKPPHNMELLPSVVGLQSSTLQVQSGDPNFKFSNGNPDAQLSLGARVSPTSSSTAEVTVNPDFSQVESDPGQIDVNATFALYFEERRPFFQEGSELYQTPLTAVYTRSINDPIMAGKFTGRFGKTNIAYSIARDDHSPFLIPGFEASNTALGGKSTVNLFRSKTSLGKGSYIGLIGTDRRINGPGSGGFLGDGGGSGSLLGVDGAFRFLKNWEFDLQTLYSDTHEPNDSALTSGLESVVIDRKGHNAAFNGESYSGYATNASLSRDTRVWDFELSYRGLSPTFRAENGYVTRNDYQQLNTWTSLSFRHAKGLILQINPSLSIGGILAADHSAVKFGLKDLQDSWINPHLYLNATKQTNIDIDYIYSREVYYGKEFPGISRLNFNWNTRLSSTVSGGFFISHGHIIARNLDDPQLAIGNEFELSSGLRLGKHLVLEPDFSYARLDYRQQYLDQHPDSARNIYSGFIFRTKTTYQFNREWKLRLVVQYNDFSEQLDIEPLLTWQLSPFTIFYVGASSQMQNYSTADYPYLSNSVWKQSSRQFFAKLQYLLRV